MRNLMSLKKFQLLWLIDEKIYNSSEGWMAAQSSLPGTEKFPCLLNRQDAGNIFVFSYRNIQNSDCFSGNKCEYNIVFINNSTAGAWKRKSIILEKFRYKTSMTKPPSQHKIQTKLRSHISFPALNTST